MNIKKDVILWAIERAGYDYSSFSIKYPDLVKYIDNAEEMTVSQLKRISEVTFTPLGYFFLEEPPDDKINITIYDSKNKKTDKISIHLRQLIYSFQYKQGWLSDYSKHNGYDSFSNYIGKLSKYNNNSKKINDLIVNDIANELHKILDTYEYGLSMSTKKSFLYFCDNFWNSVKHKFPYIFSTNIVENNKKRRISLNECIGMTLIDEYAPIIFINSEACESIKMFVAAYSIVHILLNVSASYALPYLIPPKYKNEILCYKSTIEYFIPKLDFENKWSEFNGNFKDLSEYYKVSEIIVAIRAFEMNKISRKEYKNFYKTYLEDKPKRSKKKHKDMSYEFLVNYLGNKFVSEVMIALMEQDINYREACKLLDIDYVQLEYIIREHFKQ